MFVIPNQRFQSQEISDFFDRQVAIDKLRRARHS